MKSSIAVAALSALAQEHRLEIFRLLVRKGIQGIPAGEVEKTGYTTIDAFFSFKPTQNAGLIQCRRESRTLFYSANYLSMNELMAYLTENCCKGDAETCENSVVSISEASGK